MDEDQTTRPTPARKESFSDKLKAYVKLAADVAGIVMDLRDSPSRKDWFSVAFRTANVGIGWYSERRKRGGRVGVWEYFNNDDSGWVSFPSEYAKMVVSGAQDLQVADEFLEIDVKLPYAVVGRIGSEVVGWGIESGQVTEGPYYREDRAQETFDALGALLWRILGGKHVLYSPQGLVLDTFDDHGVIPTKQMHALLDRIVKFARAGEARGYLLGGVPGTGKSVAIRWLTKTLGMTSVRIDLRMLDEASERRGSSLTVGLETMLRVLKPDVMILDDLDRIEVTAQVLAMLERARQTCRIVVASANHVSDLAGAASRPGRFDDILEFTCLDEEVVQALLGGDRDLAPQVADLPAAYVREFASRCRVLGREQAILDLPELRTRAAETSEDGD